MRHFDGHRYLRLICRLLRLRWSTAEAVFSADKLLQLPLPLLLLLMLIVGEMQRFVVDDAMRGRGDWKVRMNQVGMS